MEKDSIPLKFCEESFLFLVFRKKPAIFLAMNAELAASKIEDDNYVKDVPYILTTRHQQMHLNNSSTVFQVVIKFALSLDIILR